MKLQRASKNIIKRICKEIQRIKLLKYGFILLLLIMLIVVFAPLLVTHDPNVLGDHLLDSPSKQHWLGTDGLGRDIYSMLIYGTRTSLTIGIVSAFIAGVIGTIVGAVSGYFGGRIDRFISEVINVFLMIPTFFLILIIIAIFGSSLMNVIIVIGLTSWPSNARLMRAQALSLKERVFVQNANVIGENHFTILFKYIIPNGVFSVVANTTLLIAGAILTEAGLSFLGLGDPNTISWGQMIYDGKSYLSSAWWISTFSGIATVILVTTFFLIGDGLNKTFDPRLSKGGR